MSDDRPIHCGSFELIEPVGEGGVATVWRGRHRRRDFPVALKVITGPNARNPEYQDAFRREVQSHARLDHPGIITVFEYGTIPQRAETASEGELVAGSPYFALEFTGAGTLREQRRVDNWPLLRSVLLEVLDALAYAHARGVIHRDLKPENILYFPGDKRGRFKLSDFGIAHAVESTVPVGTDEIRDAAAGTPHYMPPEQIHGEWRVFGPWTDLYALGCMAYEFVDGELPFEAGSLAEVAAMQLNEPPPRLEPDYPVPDGLEAWIRCMLAKDPRDRFRRAADAAWLLARMPASLGHSEGARPRVLEDASATTLDLQDSNVTETNRDTKKLWQEEEGDEFRAGKTKQLGVEYSSSLLDEPGRPRLTTLAVESTQNLYARPLEADEDEDPGPALEDALVTGTTPPLPENWRYRLPDRPPTQFIDVGLGLFGLREIPFVDRDEERDVIWESLKSVYDESGIHAVEIAGSAGTGKSRLARWMAQRAHELGGVSILEATHSRQGGPTEGIPSMVETALNAWELDRERTYERVAMEIGALYKPLERSVRRIEDEARALTEIIYPTPGGVPDVEGPRYHFSSTDERFAAIARLLRELSRERPVIMLLDDVQWGGDAAGLVEYLFENEPDLPVFVLLTVQTDQLLQRLPVADMLKALRGDDRYRRIELGALDTTHQAELINRLLPLEPDVAHRVLERTDGVPLFAVQLLGDWIERGILQMGEEAFTTTSPADESRPIDMDALWKARVTRILDSFSDQEREQARESLELAAALGPHVDLEEWRAVCKRANVSPNDELYERLVREGLAWPKAQGWSFVHGLLVEELEREARKAERWIEQNRHCAATLSYLYADDNPRVQRRRVEHLLEAGEDEEALEPLFRLAKYYFGMEEYERLHRALDKHRELLERLQLAAGDRRRLQNLRLRAQSRVRTGDLEDGERLVEQLSDDARMYGWTAERGWAELLRAKICHDHDEMDEALEALDHASRWFRQAELKRGIAEVCKQRGSIHRRRGEFDRSREAYREALHLFDELGAVAEMIDIWTFGGYTWFVEGEMERAASMLERALARAREFGNDAKKARCWNYIGEIRRFRADWRGAEKAYGNAVELSAPSQTISRNVARVNLALVALGRGDYDAAENLLEKSAGRTYDFVERIHAVARGCLAAVRGDWEEWDRQFEAAVDGSEASRGVEADEAWLAEIAADIALEQGETQRACEALAFAAKRWRRLGRTDRAESCEDRMAGDD